MNFSVNQLNVCRTCLTENCTMKSIFSMEEIMEQPSPLCDILMSCASVQVYKGDGLPEHVCLKCAQEMSRAFLFRKLCEKSDVALRQCFNEIQPLREEADNFESKPETKAVIEGVDSSERVPVNEDVAFDDYNNSDSDSTNDKCCQNRKSEETVVTNETKKQMYDCKECNQTCSGLGGYRKHMRSRHLKCDVCHKEFKSKTFLNRHKLNGCHDQSTKSFKNKTGIVKKRNLPRTCTICNKTFRFHSNLERHKLIHTGEKPYLCNVCGKGFAQLSYLKIHYFIHTGEKPYKCQMCEKSFAAPGTLMTHIRTHTGERPHICKICGKDFPQSGYLSAHVRTHTGEKPVECKVCHRRFNQSGRLIVHMRIHSGEKPYTCTDCGRSFAVKGTLKKHIRTHTGERPYKCNICGQAFAQSGTLATHMKVHRPK